MKNKHSRKPRINKNDINLFHYIFDQKIVSFDQLKRKFFPNTTNRALYYKLHLFKKEDLIRKRINPLKETPSFAYEITEKTYYNFIHKKGVNDRIIKIKSDAIAHDLMLSEIREKFENLHDIVAFHPENRIQAYHEYSDHPHYLDLMEAHPDAIVEFQFGDNDPFSVPLEYESEAKSFKRWEEKWMEYQYKTKSNKLLYICSDSFLMEKMIRGINASDLKDDFDMYMSTISYVLNEKEQLPFWKQNLSKYLIGHNQKEKQIEAE